MKKIFATMAFVMCISAPVMAEQMMNKSDNTDAKVDYMMTMTDSNSDNFISKEEQSTMMTKMFVTADVNKDGKLSRDELKMAKEKEMQDFKAAKGDANKEMTR